jgi:hypothetical protein
MELAILNPIPIFVCLVWRCCRFGRGSVSVAGSGILFSLALRWLHLEVGGEDVPPLGNQPSKVGTIAFHRHINATRVNILRRVYKLDASPHGRDARILKPDSESGGQHLYSPRHALWPNPTAPRIGCPFSDFSVSQRAGVVPPCAFNHLEIVVLVALGFSRVQTRTIRVPE